MTIAEIRPNGTALVRGEKVLNLSQGEEWVQVSGIIRLADIDQDNRISSIRVADARISYSGKGAVPATHGSSGSIQHPQRRRLVVRSMVERNRGLHKGHCHNLAGREL